MTFYNRYYRGHGLRKLQHLQSPVINEFHQLLMPRNSVIHYLPEDSVLKGIPAEHWAVKDSERLVMVEHIETLSKGSTEGNPRRTAVIPEQEIRNYHRRYRRHKRIRDFSRDTRDLRTPVAINYGLLHDLYRYTQSAYSTHYRHSNLLKTLCDNLNLYAGKMDRQHFFEMHLPKPIPPLSVFRRADDNFTREIMGIFHTFDHLVLLHLWYWLGQNRKNSHLSLINPNNLSKINLIIRNENNWIMFNLGRFDEWRKGIEDEGDINPDALQKRFLKLLIILMESSTPVTQKTDKEIIIDNMEKAEKEIEKEDTATKDEEPEPVETKEEIRKTLKRDVESDEVLEKELDALKDVIEKQDSIAYEDPFANEVKDISTGISMRAEELAVEGIISSAELKRYESLAEEVKNIPNPYTGEGKITEVLTKEKTDTTLVTATFPKKEGVIDESMLESTIQDFDSQYVEKLMKKDIVNNVMNFNRAGIAVTSYDVEEVVDLANEYEIHTIKLNPVRGKNSTVRFKIPKVDKNGVFKANNISYKMRKQRADIPIRKVKPNRVALTSYYGKVFVQRSEKVVNDYGTWLVKNIRQINMDNDPRITDLKAGRSISETVVAPRLYSILGGSFRSFESNGIKFYFNYAKRFEYFGEERVKQVEKDGNVIIGIKDTNPVTVDFNDTLYLFKDNKATVIGKIEEVIGLEGNKVPVDTADLKLFSKSIPLGVAIAYYVGLDKLLGTLTKGSVKRFVTGERYSLTEHEFAIRFEDETLVVDREDKLNAIILSGFNTYKNSIKNYSIHDFNHKDIYFNIFDDYGLTTRYLNELDLLNDLFIDPITLELLQELNEPVTWLGLLKRAAELLLTDFSPAESDMQYMRIRGYERIAGAVYLEMVNSMRGYMSKGGTTNASVDMKPFAVWKTISEDPSVVIVEESNPIKNINESEAVTFMGVGGRGRTSMVAKTRAFSKSDVGVISEATVDSGDVAINTYTSANPKFKSLRGLTEQSDVGDLGASSVFSTAALLSPASDSDDGKRVNFITIQHAQGISAKGYRAAPLRTGYEKVVGDRTSDLFCTVAKKPGKIGKVTAESLEILYKDGTVEYIEIGRRFGVAAGSVIPHSVVTQLKEGQAFKEGQTLAYNEDFFEPDPLTPSESVWKAGVLCKTAIMESPDTFEDSSVISERISRELGTGVTHVRHLFFSFDQTIRNLLSEGTIVEPESILCTIEDSVTADNDLFNEETLDTLKLLSGNSPRAKYKGKIEKIEVIYYGDKEDMSESLFLIADKFDKALIKRRKALGLKPVTGQMSDSIRIDNKVLELDTLVIKVYITSEDGVGAGDKGVFGNQMKTIFGRVMTGVNETESGNTLDALFSYQSINNRIVLSPEIMGTTNTLLKVISKRVAKVYKGEKV